MVPVPVSHKEWNPRSDSCLVPQKRFQVPVLEITPSFVNYPYSRLFSAKKHISKNSGSGSGFVYWRGALSCAHWMW